MLSNVDLPQPEGPTKETNSSGYICRLIFCKAISCLPCAEKVLYKLRTSNFGWLDEIDVAFDASVFGIIEKFARSV